MKTITLITPKNERTEDWLDDHLITCERMGDSWAFQSDAVRDLYVNLMIKDNVRVNKDYMLM